MDLKIRNIKYNLWNFSENESKLESHDFERIQNIKSNGWNDRFKIRNINIIDEISLNELKLKSQDFKRIRNIKING